MTREHCARVAYLAYAGLRLDETFGELLPSEQDAWRAVADAIGPRCECQILTKLEWGTDEDGNLSAGNLKPCTLPAWHDRDKEPCR